MVFKKYLSTSLLVFSLLCTTLLGAQDFEALYKKAKADYENYEYNSSNYDKALNSCPDITKYAYP